MRKVITILVALFCIGTIGIVLWAVLTPLPFDKQFNAENYKNDLIAIKESHGDSAYLEVNKIISKVIELNNQGLGKSIFDSINGKRYIDILNYYDNGFLKELDELYDDYQFINTEEGSLLNKIYNNWIQKSFNNNISFYQWRKDNSELSFSEIDVKPFFKQCKDTKTPKCFQKAINREIRKLFFYSKEAKQKNLQGRVYLTLRIDEKGIIKVKEAKGSSEILKENAIEIINLFPRINPGFHQGRPRAVIFEIPITFKI